MRTTKLSKIGLSNRATHVVYRLLPDITDIIDQDVMAKRISELGVATIETAPDAGSKSVDEIRAWVEARGFQLRGDIPPEIREQLADARALLERWGFKVTKSPKR